MCYDEEARRAGKVVPGVECVDFERPRQAMRREGVVVQAGYTG